MVHLKTWYVVSETKGQDQIRVIENGSKKSLGANRGICVEETGFRGDDKSNKAQNHFLGLVGIVKRLLTLKTL
ncbi:hypothetical protein ACROAG_21035, partial [Shewanella oncorhynchi]|uniref:hypothetical protein n=1 Tax=Shewanella oncorhynchi TaxID=2726434 RepID=UPI003D7A6437